MTQGVGVNVWVNCSYIIKGSNDQLQIPISILNLYTVEETSQLTLKVNGVGAICEGFNCNYSFIPDQNAPIITKFNITANIISMGFDKVASFLDPNINFRDQVDIEYGGSACTIVYLDIIIIIIKL